MESVDFFGWSLVDEKDFGPSTEVLSYQHFDNLGSNLSQHLRPRFQAPTRHLVTTKRRFKAWPQFKIVTGT